MKNTLFKKVLAVALACTMTFSMATVTHAADAKEITIGVTSFADTLEPTEQYFSWVVSRYAIGECLTKFDEEGEIVPCLGSRTSRMLSPSMLKITTQITIAIPG